LYNLTESIRIIATLIKPFMENTSKEIFDQIGFGHDVNWEDANKWGIIKSGAKVKKGKVLFPRIDVEKELKRLEEANQKLIEQRSKVLVNEEKKEEEEEYITIEDFDKIQLKVAEVIEAQLHPKADKLLVLQVKIGEEVRQIVSGIRKYYSPEDLIGKKVVVIANLKPVKLRGVESNGMILAAEKDGKLTLVSTLEDIESGATIS